jgi:peroxiredoxin
MPKSLFAAVVAMALASPAFAALKIGDAAPDFAAPATLGDAGFIFSLKDALKKGPVVVYFYPAAFTSGCTAEAHDFAEAAPDFAALHTTVIGVSQDKIATLQKFATSECRKKFAVAADTDGAITKNYDAVLGFQFIHKSNRTSYAIAPNGKVIAVWSALDPDEHVTKMLAAVKAWAAQK